MTAINQDVRDYHAGDSLTLAITVTDDQGDPVDISGASITWTLEDIYGNALLSKSTDSDISITGAAAGEFEVSIAPSDTEDIQTDETYEHEAVVTDSGGDVSTVTTGEFEIL